MAIQERMAQRNGSNQHARRGSGNISGPSEPGDSRDIAARAAGLGSGKTLEAAQRVIEHGLSRRHQHVGTGPVLVALEGEDSIEPVPDRSAAPAQAPAPR